ncbi:hypothetical protein [Azospirillum canadense]|uniref:hypothetical protein n=1 Tax=Azospirillum canadense TaxID=403962 RepID=UPI0022265610|nr:hypothetical protein [Azospirillum canadense]MCW2242308.1 hypothetical protein [Azospirillum canadense]
MSDETAPRSLNGTPLTTMRGPLSLSGYPYGLSTALERYEDLRAAGSYERADQAARTPALAGPELTRLMRGMQRLTFRSILAVARRHSGVCPVYVRQKTTVLGTLMGLFYWNDGCGETRRRLLLLAWKKGVAA